MGTEEFSYLQDPFRDPGVVQKTSGRKRIDFKIIIPATYVLLA